MRKIPDEVIVAAWVDCRLIDCTHCPIDKTTPVSMGACARKARLAARRILGYYRARDARLAPKPPCGTCGDSGIVYKGYERGIDGQNHPLPHHCPDCKEGT